MRTAPLADSVASAAVDDILGSAHRELFIGGKWRPSSDGTRFDVSTPSDGSAVASVANATLADASAAADAAAEAFPRWAATAPRVRAEILRRAFDSMTRDLEQLAHLIVIENGKSLTDARAEVAYAAEFLRWFSEEAVRIPGSLINAPQGANRFLVVHQPVGVAALITPWNFPAAMITRKVGPALAAGCTVVVKPAGETPLTALVIARHLEEAGAPAGTVNVVTSARSAAVVETLLRHDSVRKVSFTGSTRVGKILLHQAADRVLSSSMELGGNAPFIVLEDANLDDAVAGAIVAKLRNGGEACTAANRFIVHRNVAAEFATRLVEAMSQLKVGHGLDPDTDIGPLVSNPARDEVHRMVRDAVASGAELTLGGEIPEGPGSYYPPTVLTNVAPDSPILQEEIFGPVAPITVFDTVEQAVELANNADVGLAGYVYTGRLDVGLRVAEHIEAGMVGVNRPLVSDPAAPFGGVKEAGLGREGAQEGLLEYTETKLIATQW